VAGRCAAGQQVDDRTREGFDHVGVVVEPRSPLVLGLLAWTQERLDGTPPLAGCRTTTSRPASLASRAERPGGERRTDHQGGPARYPFFA
jgi:hypothetical protein